MLEFRKISLSDKERVRTLLLRSDYNATDYNFTVMYIWRHIIHTNIAYYKDMLLVRYANDCEDEILTYGSCSGKVLNYLFPAGKRNLNDCVNKEDLDAAIELIFEDAKSHNATAAFICVLEEQKVWLEDYANRKQLKTKPTIATMRNSFDYIYSAENLITLKGKKYQSKRNFVNGFKRDNDWVFEPINQGNIEECRTMNDEWCKLNGCQNNGSLQAEGCSVRCALDNYFELNLQGGLLRVDGRVVAFTIGEKMNSNTLLVHIEKAFADIRGAYPTICHEFLNYMNNKLLNESSSAEQTIDSDDTQFAFEFINREDDAGDLGLRRAKEEYHPTCMVEKYYISFSNE